MIRRTKYLNKILPFIDKPLIKAIIGVRRSGKTVLLSQIADIISARAEPSQIVAINFESFQNKPLPSASIGISLKNTARRTESGSISSSMRYRKCAAGKKPSTL